MAEPSTSGPLAVLAQLNQLWGQQPRTRKVLAFVVVIGVVALLVVTRLVDRSESWSTLSEASSPDDAQELMTTLQARNLPVRLQGGKVEVRSDRVEEARAVAAAAGLPRTGKGFEIFDSSKLGQSSFAEQVNYRRALQGELSRSITALAQVQGARVHIALGKRSVFKDRDEPASASVALHLHAGQTLGAEQVRGVRQLVAASIEGLRPEAVVIVDNHGNLLDAIEASRTHGRDEIERSLTARVRAMLERVVGEGKVSVVATAVVDEREISETQEVFDNTTPVIRSESRSINGVDATTGVGGVAGARGNLPGAPAAAPTPAAASSGNVQETKNYEISRTVRQMKKPDAQLLKVHLAVLVDFKTGADGKPAARTEAELAELTAVARQAAGIDETRGDKIEVRSIPFIAPEASVVAVADAAAASAALPLIPIAIGGGALLLVLFAVIVLVARRRTKRHARPVRLSLAFPAPIADIERALDANAASGMELSGASELAALPPGKPTRERLLATVRADVERTAELLTNWLSEPPPKGVKS